MTKILLVEDNEMNRDMLSRRLQKNGYNVVVAVDGEEGVVKARTEPPALAGLPPKVGFNLADGSSLLA